VQQKMGVAGAKAFAREGANAISIDNYYQLG
jgi:hypothetical protein